MLRVEELLAGSKALYEVEVPPDILSPGASNGPVSTGCVRLRPLNLGALMLITNATRDNPGLAPLLMVKESLVEPTLTIDQIRQLHLGLLYFLVEQVNRISGLNTQGLLGSDAAATALGQTHVLLARHFGWTPEQVSQLTPGQIAVYLAGIEKLKEGDRS
jgi:hypothetical protein